MTHSNSKFSRYVRAFTPQLKSMNVVVWPIGKPGYEWTPASCGLENVEILFCPDRASLENLVRDERCHYSDEDWVEGHFEVKFAELQTAILAISDQRLSHVIWAAIGPEAGKRLLWDPPIRLDWAQSCILSGAYTPPTLRGKNLYPYTMSEALRQLKSMGMTNVYGAFHCTNVASKKGLQKTGALLAAVCHRVRLRIPRHGIRYVPLLSYGSKPGSNHRWYRRQFTDQIDLEPVSIE